ncbi:MAG: flagellar hook-length control protein FliK [Butyrivibrio sp.]|nr:flagellar hook-length control protein FliK [Acetatifactor muris]MCM1558530.1 flagellar hook-length control protein FliK [Butyrivibrio sp.]
MKLSQLFTGQSRTENRVEENGRTPQSQYARTADLNRQIHSLVPGQTIRGEIVSRNGSEVQIRLSDDMVMNARVDQSINLELGKNVTFEVKSNGGTLSLSPLFTNIAADANVLKALDMAGLPVNDTSVLMTEQLMKAGLPVNRTSLQQIYREINAFPEAGEASESGGRVSDVVNLHKLQLPVNEANLQQMASYRNLTHQLIKGMTSVLDALPEAANNMLKAGNDSEAAGLYRELFSMVLEEAVAREGMAGAEGIETAVVQEGLNGEGETAVGVSREEGATQAAEASAGAEEAAMDETARTEVSVKPGLPAGGLPELSGESGGTLSVTPETRRELTRNMLQALQDLQLPSEEAGALSEAVQRFGRGELSTVEFFRTAAQMLDAAGHTEGGIRQLQGLFGGKAFQNILTSQLKELWTMRPEDVSKPEKVEELYRRIDRQMKGLLQALETGGQGNSTAYRAAANVAQNVDFMNQMNQMYTYVQLPLHLQHSEAHGDLYVYTNKRSLARSDGQVSALLHLDMEHLGPLDVYVTLQESKVSTKFYVADDEILDFIEAHMDILTKRLEKRGYSCSASMTVRGEKEKQEGGGLAPLLQQEKGILLSQYAFDVRT